MGALACAIDAVQTLFALIARAAVLAFRPAIRVIDTAERVSRPNLQARIQTRATLLIPFTGMSRRATRGHGIVRKKAAAVIQLPQVLVTLLRPLLALSPLPLGVRLARTEQRGGQRHRRSTGDSAQRAKTRQSSCTEVSNDLVEPFPIHGCVDLSLRKNGNGPPPTAPPLGSFRAHRDARQDGL
jgi:hypothetical protein